MNRLLFACVAALAASVASAEADWHGTVDEAKATPCDLDFKLVHERRFQLDGTGPMGEATFLPGAQYTARVGTLPAVVKFVRKNEDVFRYELKADDPRLPPVPFDLSLLVAGRSKIGVYAGMGPSARLLELVHPGPDFDPCVRDNASNVVFRAEQGASDPQSLLSAGIGQADIRFVTEGRENRPYVENGRLFITFSARSYGSWLGVMSIDPKRPSDLRVEGTIFFDYGDGLLRNDVAADLFHDCEAGEWRAYVSNFSTGIGAAGTTRRAKGGVNVAWSKECPLKGVHVMKAKSLGLDGMNEDPDGIWDAEAGRWRLLVSAFENRGIKASLLESKNWDGPFARVAGPVREDSTGTTIFPFQGKRYCLSGSSEKACHVYTYPTLEKVGCLRFDRPPWPKDGRPTHGRVWPAIAEFEDKGGKSYLLVTMDRENFPGMPKPNWTYGKLMVYVGNTVE